MGALLTPFLIAWDFAVDPTGWKDAVPYRIAIMVILSIFALYFHLNLWPKLKTYFFVITMVATQAVFLGLLDQLDDGHKIGSGAFLVWLMFLPLISMGLTFKGSLYTIFALSTAPLIWHSLGLTPNLLVDVFIMYTWPFGAIIVIIIMVNDKLVLQTIRDQRSLQEAKEKAEILAQTDSLSGMNNRRAFFDLGETALQSAKRYNRALSLIALDIDHFKRINDTFGHAIGDIAIKEVAKTIGNIIRTTDISGRIGGEEFAIILPETSLESAQELAERLRHSIKEINIVTDNGNLAFTASFGVVGLKKENPTLNEALNQADAALYKAKEHGRDRVVTALPS
ncbi:MAG: GGDEF domain-containing protein [Rhodospirillales bacterium]|nr:GGDEF domain-containing protein [Rhodospirillales bacterium]